MEDAKAWNLSLAIDFRQIKYIKNNVQDERNDCNKAFHVNESEVVISADLGSSSIYLYEVLFLFRHEFLIEILIVVFGWQNFEIRSGEGFFAIGDHAKVSRS